MPTHENNQDQTIQDPLQIALFKAARIGNINLVQELIEAGANPFMLDEENRNAIFYATRNDPTKTDKMLMELESVVAKFRKRK